jgi:hypothetical protein
MMKKQSILAGALLLMSVIGQAHAGAITGTTGSQATRYDVTVKKVELCRSSSCSDPFVLGTKTAIFDIASANAGAEVGQFINLEGIPLFQTWSHVRVTLSTTFTITGDDGTCRTNGGTGVRTAFSSGAASGGTALAATMELPNQATVRAAGGGLATFDYSDYGITQTDGASEFTMTVALSSPYTCKGEMPRVEVGFDTSEGFGHTGGACNVIFPQPPTVTITATDP